MKAIFLSLLSVFGVSMVIAQDVMTPERLWQLRRVSAVGITPDGQQVLHPQIKLRSSSLKV